MCYVAIVPNTFVKLLDLLRDARGKNRHGRRLSAKHGEGNTM
jgi:hypothetical protein